METYPITFPRSAWSRLLESLPREMHSVAPASHTRSSELDRFCTNEPHEALPRTAKIAMDRIRAPLVWAATAAMLHGSSRTQVRREGSGPDLDSTTASDRDQNASDARSHFWPHNEAKLRRAFAGEPMAVTV